MFIGYVYVRVSRMKVGFFRLNTSEFFVALHSFRLLSISVHARIVLRNTCTIGRLGRLVALCYSCSHILLLLLLLGCCHLLLLHLLLHDELLLLVV